MDWLKGRRERARERVGPGSFGPSLPIPCDVYKRPILIPDSHALYTHSTVSTIVHPITSSGVVPTLTFVSSHNPWFNFRMVSKRHVPSRKRMWLAWGIIALGVASGAAQDSSTAQVEPHDSTVTVRHSLQSGTHPLRPVCPDRRHLLF
jgi:hypothetical protein